MSRITACPQCHTRFRVTEAQLQARNGKVRCGRCDHVFNALDALIEEPPLPATEPAPIEQAGIAEQVQEHPPAQELTVTSGQEAQQDEAPPPAAGETTGPLFELEITHPETPPDTEEPLFELEVTPPEGPADAAALAPESIPLTSAAEETTAAEATEEPAASGPEPQPAAESKAETRVVRIQPPPVTIQPKVSPERPKYAPPPKPRRAWPWALANMLLLTGLAIQGIYSFRDAIAAHYPPTRSLLEQACIPLQCRVSLPRNPDLISIESSELHADPARPNIVVLTSVLRNRAAHVQAYPTLELTLTSARDEMVARKLFTPKEYLRNAASLSLGIAPSGEVAVKLLLDLGDLKAEGYRLYLFYPS
ncbi:MAG: hypothetical protein C3F18_11695 [Nitrosomonadales bacterium]|nr:MAG: hypothetical protein C3F18_11695 [Nitrosomonadales bacterium]